MFELCSSYLFPNSSASDKSFAIKDVGGTNPAFLKQAKPKSKANSVPVWDPSTTIGPPRVLNLKKKSHKKFLIYNCICMKKIRN